MSKRTFIDAGAWNLRVLERRWQRAQPFPHIVLPDAVDAESCEALTAALDDEPAERLAGEIYEMNATGEELSAPALVALTDELGGEAMLSAISSFTGKQVTRVKARGYAFRRGDYLLPHADRDADALRRIAFALYVSLSPDLEGGELELFDCTVELGHVIETEPAGRITPRAGTLAIFDVSEASIHQVREVTQGARGSISGWFY